MTFEDAKDIILAVLLAAIPEGTKVIWPDVPDQPPTSETLWLRATLRTATGDQSSLSSDVGTKKYTVTGTLFVEVMQPMGQGGTTGVQLAQTIVNAYRDARQDVWYRNARMREMGAQGAFSRTDVLVDFSFDDVR